MKKTSKRMYNIYMTTGSTQDFSFEVNKSSLSVLLFLLHSPLFIFRFSSFTVRIVPRNAQKPYAILEEKKGNKTEDTVT